MSDGYLTLHLNRFISAVESGVFYYMLETFFSVCCVCFEVIHLKIYVGKNTVCFETDSNRQLSKN